MLMLFLSGKLKNNMILKLSSDINKHDTRSSNNVQIRTGSGLKFSKCFIDFNSLPTEIQKCYLTYF